MALVPLPATDDFNNGLGWIGVFQKEAMGQVIEDIRRYTWNRLEMAIIS
jgi:hypothetical protein